MHVPVNYLHATAAGGISKLTLADVARRISIGSNGSDSRTDKRSFVNSDKAFLMFNPVWLHILYMVTVRQYNNIEIDILVNGEVKRTGAGRNITNDIHAVNKTKTTFSYNFLYWGILSIDKESANKTITKSRRITDTFVTDNRYFKDLIVHISFQPFTNTGSSNRQFVAVTNLCNIIIFKNCTLRNFRTVLVIGETRIFLAIDDIINTFIPVMGFKHHNITFSTVKFSRSRITSMVSVSIVIRI